MDLHLYVHLIGENGKLDVILHKLDILLTKERQIMATLDELVADVTAESTVVASVLTFIDGLKQQLADALAGGVSPAAQAKVDAIFAQVEANKTSLSNAIVANTPAQP